MRELTRPVTIYCSDSNCVTLSLTKYTTAGQALGDVLKKFIPQVVAGKKVLDLCIE